MSNVRILFKSINYDSNECIEFMASGTMAMDGESFIIEYEEPDSNVNVLLQYNNNEIIFIRDGEYYNKMVFLKDKQSFATYYIENKRMDFKIDVNKMLIDDSNIILMYEIVVDEYLTNKFKIEIKLES